MILAVVLLWVVIILAGVALASLFINGAFTGGGAIAMLVCVGLMAVCWNGLERIDAAETCDAIQNLGGAASFAGGKCLIKSDGGFPVDKGNSRFVYFTQQ